MSVLLFYSFVSSDYISYGFECVLLFHSFVSSHYVSFGFCVFYCFTVSFPATILLMVYVFMCFTVSQFC